MADDAFPRLMRFSADDFERMAREGHFGGRTVELRDGLVVEMSPVHVLHARLRRQLARRIEEALRGHASLEVVDEISVRFDNGFYPQPDMAVFLTGVVEGAVPGSHVRLIIEVADTTLADDLGPKRALYAAAGCPEYWVVDARGRRIHQFARPAAEGYVEARTVAFGAPAASFTLPGLTVDTTDLP